MKSTQEKNVRANFPLQLCFVELYTKMRSLTTDKNTVICVTIYRDPSTNEKYTTTKF